MGEHRTRGGLLRTRWAAIGAAVAVSLGAGGMGIGIGHATTSSGEKPIYLPIKPCRLADTRPEFQVGPRSAPLGPNETYDLAGWGAVGDCTLPNDTAGLALNVTAVDPSAPTFLTLFPDGVPLPLASNLNPTPGEPPTPNAVNVDLSTVGVFSIYNLAGNVHIAIDVVGIYDDHNHDDRYYTEGEVDTAVAAAVAPKANSADVYTKAEVESLVFDGTIPSGVTVTGNFLWDGHGSTSTSSDAISVDFPGRAPVPLTDNNVNFDQPGSTGDGDPQCMGTANAPTAPPGKVCIYLSAHNGMATNTLTGNAGLPLADAGFYISWSPDGTDNVDQFVLASWAYTAP